MQVGQNTGLRLMLMLFSGSRSVFGVISGISLNSLWVHLGLSLVGSQANAIGLKESSLIFVKKIDIWYSNAFRLMLPTLWYCVRVCLFTPCIPSAVRRTNPERFRMCVWVDVYACASVPVCIRACLFECFCLLAGVSMSMCVYAILCARYIPCECVCVYVCSMLARACVCLRLCLSLGVDACLCLFVLHVCVCVCVFVWMSAFSCVHVR